MNRLLLEVGVSENMECPACGYEGANHDYESRGEFTPQEFHYDGAYLYYNYCPLCGWAEYEDFKPEDENEDDWPSDPLTEYEPSNEQVKTSQRIQKLLEAAPDSVEDMLMEFIWQNFDPETWGLSELRWEFTRFIFSQRR